MKGIVLGNGFLGTRIAEEFGLGMCTLRIENEHHSLDKLLEELSPDFVVNTIGETGKPNIDWCQRLENRDETTVSNSFAPLIIRMACEEKGIYLVHLSSGCIYTGDKNGLGYSEEDSPNFLDKQWYATTKIMGELALRDYQNCLILRLRMPIDISPHDRNLITKLSRYPRVINEPNSMTTVPHMLCAVEDLIEREKTGIYHLVNPGTISPYEIMQLYREIVDPNHTFGLMSLKELNETTECERSNCKLDTTKLQREGIILPDIHDAVIQCLEKYKKLLKH